jgi:hypothetical protein
MGIFRQEIDMGFYGDNLLEVAFQREGLGAFDFCISAGLSHHVLEH